LRCVVVFARLVEEWNALLPASLFEGVLSWAAAASGSAPFFSERSHPLAETKAEPKNEMTQAEYDQLVALVKRGKEPEVCGRKVGSVAALNDALDHKEEYDAQVAQIKAGKMVRLHGRTALTLDELHFAINAKPHGPIELVPAGVPMVLGFGENPEASAFQATINEQIATIQELRANAQADAQEKEELKTEAECAKQAYETEKAEAIRLQGEVTGLTGERDALNTTITELRGRIEELEQKAFLAAVEAEKAQKQAAASEAAPNAPAA